MEQKDLVINGKTYPKNLKVLKDNGINDDWEIKPVYYLELKHGLMGLFPAIIADQKRMIITQDKNLLEKIWKTLSPRSSKMNESLFYVSKNNPVGYYAKHWMGDENAVVSKLLTEEEYNSLVKGNEQPFKWAPGLVGDDMTTQEFIESIESAVM